MCDLKEDVITPKGFVAPLLLSIRQEQIGYQHDPGVGQAREGRGPEAYKLQAGSVLALPYRLLHDVVSSPDFDWVARS
jgi:hypothetical protein